MLAVLIVCVTASAAPVLEVRGSESGRDQELTTIRFTVRGPYSGPVEFFQFKTVKYFQRVEQETSSSAEYEVRVPAVFDSMPFNVSADSVSHTVDARMMKTVSAVDQGAARFFGEARLERGAGLPAAVVIVLYILCVVSLARLRRGAWRTLAIAAATLLFSAAELFILRDGVDEKSVTLHEGVSGEAPYSYEFIGVGCPWGGGARLARNSGVIFPVYETVSGLFGDNLRIELAGDGSSTDDFILERGRRRVFCCVSSGGLGGGMETRDGDVVNMTGFDMRRAYLWRGGRLLDLGNVPDGGRSDFGNAGEISRKDMLDEAGTYLDPAALKLLSWRMKRLDSNDNVIFGFAPPSRVIFFGISQDDKSL